MGGNRRVSISQLLDGISNSSVHRPWTQLRRSVGMQESRVDIPEHALSVNQV